MRYCFSFPRPWRFLPSSLRYATAAEEREPTPSGFNEIIPKQEAAIEKGVAWLAKQQRKDGSWMNSSGENYTCAMTAFAGLALLASGNTPVAPFLADLYAPVPPFVLDSDYNLIYYYALDMKNGMSDLIAYCDASLPEDMSPRSFFNFTQDFGSEQFGHGFILVPGSS